MGGVSENQWVLLSRGLRHMSINWESYRASSTVVNWNSVAYRDGNRILMP